MPSLESIEATRARLKGRVRETPVWEWTGPAREEAAPDAAKVTCKLELLQVTGSFKVRGALNVMLGLGPEELKRGVTAVSAGNHAIAVAYAARNLGCTAKVVMIDTANPARIATARAYGAELVMSPLKDAFPLTQRIAQEEGRTFVHPFEGERLAQGTGTVGLELIEQAPDLDAVIVPIGGGGLCAGVASAIKQRSPACKIYGVEPEGADTMYRSFQTGKPEKLASVSTIADSLGAPYAGDYTFAECRKYIEEVVLISDDLIRMAMLMLFSGMKLAVEPAGAASTAALMGPLRDKLAGKHVGLIVCGANIDPGTFSRHLSAGG